MPLIAALALSGFVFWMIAKQTKQTKQTKQRTRHGPITLQKCYETTFKIVVQQGTSWFLFVYSIKATHVYLKVFHAHLLQIVLVDASIVVL